MPVKFWMAVFLAVALCGTATSVCAQVQSDPSGHIGPSTAEIVGILVGTGAAIGVVVYLVIPRQKTIEGCVEASDGRLQLTPDGTKHTYVLATDNVKLQAGRRVKVKGKRGRKKESGAREFEVRKLVKDEGVCG
jgi:hypothetical protein